MALPIEHEIDKQLNMSAHAGRREDMGVAGYNNAVPQAIVQRYVSRVASHHHPVGSLGRLR